MDARGTSPVKELYNHQRQQDRPAGLIANQAVDKRTWEHEAEQLALTLRELNSTIDLFEDALGPVLTAEDNQKMGPPIMGGEGKTPISSECALILEFRKHRHYASSLAVRLTLLRNRLGI